MADHHHTVDVGAAPSALFAYLTDVRNLPTYFVGMLAAEPAGGGAVRVTARLPDGTSRQAEAWFRVDEAASRMEWGAEGGGDYHGWLTVEPVGDHLARVTVGLSTSAADVERSLSDTVANIREQFESSGA